MQHFSSLARVRACAFALAATTAHAPLVAGDAARHASPDAAEIVIRMTPSRLSGPAPLAVLFDASDSEVRNGDGFHDLRFAYSFGSPAAKWAVSGKPKHVQSGGAIAAHVFDTPGTYTVRLRATAPNGRAADTLTEIQVLKPEQVFAGRTVCVSARGEFDGCPEGSARRSDVPRTLKGHRVLLRRGEEFGPIELRAGDDGVTVGAFGVGDKPVVQSVRIGGAGPMTPDWPDDLVFMDLSIRNGFSLTASGSRILLYRCDLTSPVKHVGAQVDIGTALTWWAQKKPLGPGGYYWPREIFLVENRIEGDTDNDKSPNVTVMGWFAKSALLGNTIDRATEHSVRMWAANKTVIAHNALGGDHFTARAPGIRHALKIHSSGLGAFSDRLDVSGSEIASRHVVIADNVIGTPQFPGSWLVHLAPQNAEASTIEGLEDVMVENNLFVRGPHTNTDVAWRGRRMTARGNATASQERPRVNKDGKKFAPTLEAWDGPYRTD